MSDWLTAHAAHRRETANSREKWFFSQKPTTWKLAPKRDAVSVHSEFSPSPPSSARLVNRPTLRSVARQVTYFAAPPSYTTEDVIEISCHGSPVVLRFALERACGTRARLAELGEFTLRAYLKGRIDLTRAEAVRDLIVDQSSARGGGV